MESANQGVSWSAKRVPTSREGKASRLPTPTQQNNDGLGPGVPGAPPPSTPDRPLSTPSSRATTPAPGLRPHTLRQGAARGTRSSAQKEFVSAFAWEALDIEKFKTSTAESPPESSQSRKEKESTPSTATATSDQSPSSSSDKMSRNRPRGPPVPRDNGLAANEETDMWNKILQDLRKAKEKNDKQKALAEQISALNEKIGRDGGKPSLSEHNQLDSLYRQMLKLCEDERAILQDEPSDVIKNLGLLTALRQASEAEAPPNRAADRAAALSKSRKKRNDLDGSATDSPGPSGSALSDKVGRIKGSAQRSTSVSSTQFRDGRDIRDSGVYVKIEEGSESTKGTIAERSGHLVMGAEVVFKHNKNKQGVEGEGIQCIIKGITGDGLKKRYDVQDPEPNENGEQGAVYKTTAASLIPIPRIGTTLPSFSLGKQVLARYPDTTTFYRAEVMGSKKDAYRLKFEGEEDDKEMEVDRRFVLDIPGK
ncbi:SAGA complex component [Aspergillus heteromorphus CBS 117.55]|uniref:SAGA complex component n=1 Tax=Aspergillus heteromorphus CBS 117.55 TaxID=1448321 RepID=A0A317VX91_9EURO|nr:SAGA complex component [Aspergillus heteromorphus CBS 117.55]PWY77518.1 SAGA complex component [Aspergillus heteromorphus CBS 117.55]